MIQFQYDRELARALEEEGPGEWPWKGVQEISPGQGLGKSPGQRPVEGLGEGPGEGSWRRVLEEDTEKGSVEGSWRRGFGEGPGKGSYC